MHQGSTLSPLLFVIVMEALSGEFRGALPWKLIYADDLVVIAESEEELIKKLSRWKHGVQSKSMKVNMNKTKVRLLEKAATEYTILDDGHVVFVVEVLIETQYSVLSARNGCTGSVIV